jgi:FHS family L-fucose permease-like MFS transporter
MSEVPMAQSQASSASRSTMFTAAPVFLAFLAMGFADAAGPFVGLAKQQFSLSNFAAQLTNFVGFIMFGILSVPVGVFQDKKGKKYILVLGLSIMLAGVLIPTLFAFSTFALFLLTVLLLGAGATVLQVAGNPLMRDVSPAGKYSRNLSLAQFVKAIGSLSGPVVPVLAAHYFGLSWRAIFPFFSVAILIALISAATLRVKATPAAGHQTATLGSSLALLKSGYVAMMVLAIFVYVGAEVSVSSGIPLYLKDRFSVDIAKTGLLGTGLFFLALTIGRFSGGVFLNWIKPKVFFLITCLLSILGLLGLFCPDESVAVAGFFVVGLGFANIFPLVFSITVDKMPADANALSGLMVMAIVGGAFLPPLMGLLADATHSVQTSFLVPLSAILYITWAALVNFRSAAAASQTATQ